MDPKSIYLLEIRIVGNPRCRKVVDSDICKIEDLVDEIVDKYPPGYHELVTVAYLDDAKPKLPRDKIRSRVAC